MSAMQMIETLLARKRLFLGIVAGVVVLAFLASVFWPKTYIAEASVVVDSKSTDPVSGAAQSPDLLPSTIATQVDVIGSHNVALKVVQRLNLKSMPAFKDKFESATHGKGSIDDWLADYVLKKVSVNPSHDSHVINIDVGTNDPQQAAALANAFADAYIQTSLELKEDPARRQAEWFAEQMRNLRSTLERAQLALSTAQQASGVVGTNSQIDIENTRLAQLSTQLIAAQAAMYESQNKLKQMNAAIQLNRLDEMPEFADNTLLQTLRTDLVRAQAQLAETAERYGVHHPQYVSSAAQVSALQRKLAAELKTASGAISKTADINARQQAELQKALNQQRDRVLRLKSGNDHLDVLRRDVDSAQQAYDSGLQRANQVRLESQLDQSNIAVLNPAIVPFYAAKPKVMLNVMVAFVLGCILGLAAVVAAESVDQRVRSVDSLAALTGVLVLSEIPRDRIRPRRWPRLKFDPAALLTQTRRESLP